MSRPLTQTFVNRAVYGSIILVFLIVFPLVAGPWLENTQVAIDLLKILSGNWDGNPQHKDIGYWYTWTIFVAVVLNISNIGLLILNTYKLVSLKEDRMLTANAYAQGIRLATKRRLRNIVRDQHPKSQEEILAAVDKAFELGPKDWEIIAINVFGKQAVKNFNGPK